MAKELFETHPDEREENVRMAVFLPQRVWDRLDKIAVAETERFRSTAPPGKKVKEVSRSAIVLFFLEEALRAYDAQDNSKPRRR